MTCSIYHRINRVAFVEILKKYPTTSPAVTVEGCRLPYSRVISNGTICPWELWSNEMVRADPDPDKVVFVQQKKGWPVMVDIQWIYFHV